MTLPSLLYQHALDSGVYLPGVDTSELRGRVPAQRGPFGTRPGSLALVIAGQSNAANHGAGHFAASRAVYNFNFFDGLVYPAADPLLGATGDGGSPWCLMSDILIERGVADEILLVPVAVGGAEVKDWAPGGPRNHRLMYALGRLRSTGTVPTHVLWHQGEADALYRTPADDYRERFLGFVRSLREAGVAAPVYMAVAAYFGVPEGYSDHQALIAAEQRGLVDPAAGIFAGPCTDLIRDRYDDCHLDETGLRKHAAAWVEILTAR